MWNAVFQAKKTPYFVRLPHFFQTVLVYKWNAVFLAKKTPYFVRV